MDWKKYLSGWKVNVGMILILGATAGRAFDPADEAWWSAIEKVGLALGGVGIGHKFVKGEVLGPK